jgi:hypothetical protein
VTTSAGEPVPVRLLVSDVLSRRLHPALEQVGLRRKGRTWWQGDPDAGWLLLQVHGDRYASRDAISLVPTVTVWPPGCWEARCAVLPDPEVSVPYAAANAPLFEVAHCLDPERWPADGRVVTADSDLDLFGDDLVEFAVRIALPWARAHLLPQQAAQALLERGGGIWQLIYAAALQRRAASAELPELLDRLTERWLSSPRPPSLGAVLAGWRRDAGLPGLPEPATS